MGGRTGHGTERETKPAKKKGVFREYAETILICVVFLLFVRTFVFQQSEIPSGSMENTLLVGDYVLVNRFLYAPTSFDWEKKLLPDRPIRRGDVVVFKFPPEPEQDYIKRVIGLPGETVALVDGTLWIDGKPIDQPYLKEDARRGQTFGPVRVPEGRYFLLGDNRNHSADSREWGTAPRALIKGRAFMVLFSTSAKQPTDRPPGQVTPTSLVTKLYNLVFHSRWNRCFSWIR